MRDRVRNVLFLVAAMVTHGMASDERPVESRLLAILGKLKKAESPAGRIELMRSLREELDQIGAVQPDVLTNTDLVAMAESCQVCHRYEDSVRYAKIALAADPSLESANSVAIRSFAYLNRLEDASALLESAKQYVSKNSRVRELHSVIYFKAAASKDWQRAFPHIEAHLEYLSEATRLRPEATMRSYFWVDQFALACKRSGSDPVASQDQIDQMWHKLSQLNVSVRVPFESLRLRDRCAVLELQSAIEVHTKRRTMPDPLAEWASTIATMGDRLKDGELAAEATVLGQFLHDHRQGLDDAKRRTAIMGLLQIRSNAAFRVVPSSQIKTLQASLQQVCHDLGAEPKNRGD